MERRDSKYQTIQAIFVLGAMVLLSQIAQLQLFNSDYGRKAETTTVGKQVLYPSRGLIFDRNGRALVVNAPRYDIMVTYDQISPDLDTVKMCSLLDISLADFKRRIEQDWSLPMYSKSVPFTFMKNLSAQRFATFQEYMHEFEGFYPVDRNVRQYPFPSACHALGFIGEVDDDILRDSTGTYTLGDYIGVSGLEKKYEPVLRGKKGVNLIMKDNVGRVTGPFRDGALDVAPENGSDIITTLDLELQRYCESLMPNISGSIVALDPKSGEILSYVSAPFYDPNIMSSSKETEDRLQELLVDTLKPFFDRCIMAKYPPASIFKPIMGLIALDQGVANIYTSQYCPGYYKYEDFTYGCHHHPQPKNIKIALQHSCNSYFFQVFRNTIEHFGYKNHDKGLDVLVDYLEEFGLGHPLGIDIPSESAGFIPTSEFYDQLYPEYEWKSTYIMSIGIGQGELQLTTLQMANLSAAIANKGYYYTPHLIKGFMDMNKAIDEVYLEPNVITIDTSLYAPIIEGMERTVRQGTAYKAYNRDITFCGKTGTSQNPFGEDHSVFFGFAPMDDPQIAIAVYIENAGFGGDIAAPIASLVVEKYLRGEVNRSRLEERMRQMDLRKRNQS